MNRSRNYFRALRLSLAAASLVWIANPALAVPISFAPMSGFDNSMGQAEDFVIESQDAWLAAGSPGSGPSLALTVTESQCLKTQSAPGGACLSTSDLFLANEAYLSDVTWQIENTSGNALPTLLWFTTVNNTAPLPEYAKADVQIESDSAMLDGQAIDLDVVRYTAAIGGVPTDFFYLAVDLAEFGETGDDGMASLTFRYRVDNPMLAAGTPELAINAAQEFLPVPEPSTVALLGIGLIALATRRGPRASS